MPKAHFRASPEAPLQPFYFGKTKSASQPGPVRFAKINEPPCASAICRLKANPIPDPPGFVVKKGTNRFVGFMIPGPVSRTKTSTESIKLRQPVVTVPDVSSEASAALCKILINN